MRRSSSSAAVFFCVAMVLCSVSGALATSCGMGADLGLTVRDQERLGDLAGARTLGLADTLIHGDKGVRDIVGGLYSVPLQPVLKVADGAYRCRTIKLGYESPVIYDFFACTVTDEGRVIMKTSGSQQFSGTLIPSGEGLVYKGALHYSDENPIAYGQDAERNQVGCLMQTQTRSPSYLLELPYPAFESIHDIIVLEKTP